MHRSLVVALAVLLPLVVGAKEAVPPRLQTGLAQISEVKLRADVTFLASDAMQGRLSLEQGDDIATDWVVSEFIKAGLKPAAMDADGKASFLQAVPLIAYTPNSKATQLVMRRDGKSISWNSPDASGRFSTDLDVQGSVVFAGYGITELDLGYDDYSNVDAKGKVVVVFSGEPQTNDATSVFNGVGNTRNASSRVKVLNAQAHGAVAVLIAPMPAGSKFSATEMRARYRDQYKNTPGPQHATFSLADDEVRIPAMGVSPGCHGPADGNQRQHGSCPAGFHRQGPEVGVAGVAGHQR